MVIIHYPVRLSIYLANLGKQCRGYINVDHFSQLDKQLDIHVNLTLKLATFATSSALRPTRRSAQPRTFEHSGVKNKDIWFLFAEPQEDRSRRNFIQYVHCTRGVSSDQNCVRFRQDSEKMYVFTANYRMTCTACKFSLIK